MDNESLLIYDVNDIPKEDAFNEHEKSVLNCINCEMAGGKSLDVILDFIFNEIRTIIPCDRIDVAFIEEDNQRMVIQFVKTVYEPVYLKKGFASDIIGGSIQKVFLSGMPSVISDMEVHSHNNPLSESARLLLKEGVMSSMVCPLISESGFIGMFMCRSRRPGAYDIRHVGLQVAYAKRLSQAVDNAFHIEQLSGAMTSYMEMLSFVSHELKNPLASIVMTAKTLSEGYFGEIADRQREASNRIVRKAEYLLNLIAEYLSLASIETGEFKVRPMEVDFIADVVNLSIEIVAGTLHEGKINFQQDISPGLPQVKCDPELMKIVVTNLLSNAVKYGSEGAAVRLSVGIDSDMLRVSVWNEGPGFPESEKIKLFKRFSKLETPELAEKKGHGIGLYVTWKIIKLHGGRIRADSKHGEWAEFVMELPVFMDRCLL